MAMKVRELRARARETEDVGRCSAEMRGRRVPAGSWVPRDRLARREQRGARTADETDGCAEGQLCPPCKMQVVASALSS